MTPITEPANGRRFGPACLLLSYKFAVAAILRFDGGTSSPVGDKTSNHRTRRRHQGVLHPQLILAPAQDNRRNIHSARKRNEGVIQESERNQTY